MRDFFVRYRDPVGLVLALVLLCLYAVRRAPAKVHPTAVVLP